MKRYTVSQFVLATLMLLGLSLVGSSAWAGSRIFDFGPDTCTSNNCNSTVTNGTYITGGGGNIDPFNIQVFSTGGGECVRIELTSQGTDLEAVLVSPTGATWRDDDGGVGTLPLIKARTDVRGWYTLQISHFAGSAVGVADFTMRYGRYNGTNPNCSGPTVPFFESQAELEKSDGGASGNQRQGGTSD